MQFLEDYTLLDEIGKGGFATIYKVRHNRLDYIRAVRVLNAVIARGEEDPTYLKFIEECKVLLRLGNGNHPNIVHIYQPLIKQQRAIVEMDYVDGCDITRYVKDRKFVPAHEVVRLAAEIGSALAYCHVDIYRYCMDREADNLPDDPDDGSKILVDDTARRRLIEKYRVIHNDIHSGNIIRRENGSYVLLDFGLAVEGTDVVRSSRRNNGAPEFKAPEKWNNDTTLSPESDIYSFGIVLYEMLTGNVPFPFDTRNPNRSEAEYNLSKAHRQQRPPSVFEQRRQSAAACGITLSAPDYPQWLEEIILKCLAKDPSARFHDGKALYDAISRHLPDPYDVRNMQCATDNPRQMPTVEIPPKPASAPPMHTSSVSPVPDHIPLKPGSTPRPAVILQAAQPPSHHGALAIMEQAPIKAHDKNIKRKAVIALIIAAIAGSILAILLRVHPTRNIQQQDASTDKEQLSVEDSEHVEKI